MDDSSKIDMMEEQAKDYAFEVQTSKEPFSALAGSIRGDMIRILADQIRASLYFFHLTGIVKYHNTHMIKGVICCRLHPNESGYRELLEFTTGFYVQDKYINISSSELKAKGPLLKKVSFRQRELKQPVRIDANFGSPHSASISGCPLTLAVSNPLNFS